MVFVNTSSQVHPNVLQGARANGLGVVGHLAPLLSGSARRTEPSEACFGVPEPMRLPAQYANRIESMSCQSTPTPWTDTTATKHLEASRGARPGDLRVGVRGVRGGPWVWTSWGRRRCSATKGGTFHFHDGVWLFWGSPKGVRRGTFPRLPLEY